MDAFLAIVNPAAGNGRCGRNAAAAVERLRAAGLEVEVRETTAPRDAGRIAAEAFAGGRRRFIAGGGDGTVFEVLNGLMPSVLEADGGEGVQLGFLPFGTGNAYLREFSATPAEHAVQALIDGRRRPSDVLVLRQKNGERQFFVNLVGMGFAADVTEVTHRGLKRFGVLGYTLAVLLCLLRPRYRSLPFSLDGGPFEDAPSTFLCVCNSRYTADMLIAPNADIADGRADVVHVRTLGRWGLLRAFPSIFEGRHLSHPAVTATQAASVRFRLDEEVPMMIDGELVHLVPESVDVLPRAIEIYA